MSNQIAMKVRELAQLRAANGVLSQQVQAKMESDKAKPTQYSIFERIVSLASAHAEATTAACVIIESEFFDGQEWTGGELATMTVYEAALEFGVRAMAVGWYFDTKRGAWVDRAGKLWSGTAVKRRIIGIAGEEKGEEVTQ
jgi:hypothetical protein